MAQAKTHKCYYRKSDDTCACGKAKGASPPVQDSQDNSAVTVSPDQLNQDTSEGTVGVGQDSGMVTVVLDPDNPDTVILSRWPSEEEKPALREEISKLRKLESQL